MWERSRIMDNVEDRWEIRKNSQCRGETIKWTKWQMWERDGKINNMTCGREIEIWIMWETDGKIDRIANVGEKQ